MRQPWTKQGRPEAIRRACTAAGLSAAILAGSANAIAADQPTTAPGARLRVTTSKGRLVARFVELKGESIVLEKDKEGDPETLTVDRRDVVAIEVSERRSRKGKGAKIGALAGVGAAVAIGALAGESCHAPSEPPSWANFNNLDSNLCFGHGAVGLASAILTVPLGALVGIAVSPGEKWRPAPVSGLAVQPVAARGGFGVRVAIGF